VTTQAEKLRLVIGFARSVDREQHVLHDVVDPIGLQTTTDDSADQRRAFPEQSTVGNLSPACAVLISADQLASRESGSKPSLPIVLPLGG